VQGCRRLGGRRMDDMGGVRRVVVQPSRVTQQREPTRSGVTVEGEASLRRARSSAMSSCCPPYWDSQFLRCGRAFRCPKILCRWRGATVPDRYRPPTRGRNYDGSARCPQPNDRKGNRGPNCALWRCPRLVWTYSVRSRDTTTSNGASATNSEYMREITEASDAQLVTLIARYREVALAEVYRRHGGAVFGLARRVLNNTTEAEDVTQEVFLRLWNQPERFDPTRGSLRSYLLTQSHARAVDAIRSLNARRLREVKDANRTASAGYDLQHEVWDLSLADNLQRALSGLPEEERQVIELAYFEGLTYVKVAEVLGQPEGTVKSRIRNGMRRMRTVLVDAGIEWVE